MNNKDILVDIEKRNKEIQEKLREFNKITNEVIEQCEKQIEMKKKLDELGKFLGLN